MHLIPTMRATCAGCLNIHVFSSTDIWCRMQIMNFSILYFLNCLLPLSFYFEIFSPAIFNTRTYIITWGSEVKFRKNSRKNVFIYYILQTIYSILYIIDYISYYEIHVHIFVILEVGIKVILKSMAADGQFWSAFEFFVNSILTLSYFKNIGPYCSNNWNESSETWCLFGIKPGFHFNLKSLVC